MQSLRLTSHLIIGIRNWEISSLLIIQIIELSYATIQKVITFCFQSSIVSLEECSPNMPKLKDTKSKTFRDLWNAKHPPSPKSKSKERIYSKVNKSETISNSYIKEEWRNKELCYGAFSRAGYHPNNPLKTNQDSYIILSEIK